MWKREKEKKKEWQKEKRNWERVKDNKSSFTHGLLNVWRIIIQDHHEPINQRKVSNQVTVAWMKCFNAVDQTLHGISVIDAL